MATTRSITTNIILNGVDGMSRPLGRAVDKTTSKLDSMGNRMRMISYGAFNIGQSFAVGAAGIAAPLVYATKKALDFEDQMASVAKVADIPFGSQEFKDLGNEAKALSVYLGNTAVESAKLYETLAQGGMARKDLSAIAKIAGQVAIAFDIEAEAAGNAFGYIKNLLALNVEQTRYVADSINALSNTRLAKASKILTFMSSGGAAVARAYKMTGEEAAAFGATMIVNGQSGEEAATVMERFAKWINKMPPVLKRFNQAGGGTAGFLQVLNDGLKSKDPNQYFQKFGDYGNQIKALAMSMNDPKGLINALDLVHDRARTAGSAEREFTAKQMSTMSALKREWAGFNAIMIDVGESALPVLRDLIKDFKPFASGIADWVKENPRTVTAMVKFGGALAAMAGIIAVGSYAVGAYATAMRAYAAVAGWLVKSKTLVAIASGFKDVALYSSIAGIPVGMLAAALVGLGYVAYKTNQNLMYLPETITKIVTGTKALVRNIVPMLKALFSGDFDKVASISARADLEAEQDMRSIIYGDDARMTIDERRKRRRTGKMPEGYGQETAENRMWKRMFPETWKNNKQFGSTENPVRMPGDSIAGRQTIRDMMPSVQPPAAVLPKVPALPAIPKAQAQTNAPAPITYNPIMNFNGGAPSEEILQQMKQLNDTSMREFEKKMREVENERNRRKY